MKKINILLILIISIIVTSCSTRTIQEISYEIPVGTVITYSKDVQQIFETKCVSCHNNNSQFPNLENYVQIKEACQNGNVFCRIDDQSCGSVMPQTGKMQQQTIEMVKLWRDQGYLN